jgi:ABC-type glycerol-3-phosphate transport system substrate-binding protein
MNKRVKTILPIVALGLILSLASCGEQSSTTSSGDAGNSETSANVSVDPSIKATLSILVPSGNQNETDMIKNAFDNGFSLLYPNVTLKIDYVSISNYESSVRNLAMANKLSDIVWTNSPEYLFLIKNGIVDPLTSYINASEAAGDFNFKNDFKTAYFNMGSYKNDYYVVPRSADCVVTFYNKTLLNNAGIDVSKIKNGWSWSDFLSVCKDWRTYLDKSGSGDNYYCVDPYLTGWGSVSYPLLRSFGADVLDENGKNSIDSEGTRNAIKCIRNLTDNRYCIKSGASAASSFETGTTPFCFQSAAFSLYDQKSALKGNIDVVSFPLINDNNTPKIGGGIAGYSINKKASNKALAWQFLNYLISNEGQNLMAEGGLNLAPIRKDMADYTKEKWGEGYTDKNLSAYLVYDDDKITEEYLSRVDPKYLNRLQLAFQDFIGNAASDKKTIDQVVASAVSDIDDALSI